MKKVLIVTYYWPPAGGPGVQRWLSFVKYLPEYGIQPILYIPDNPHYPIVDQSLSEEVPEGLTIYRRPIWEPYGWASRLSKKKTNRISSGIVPTDSPSLLEKMLLWIRGNLFIPDARKFWVTPSVKYLTKILEKEDIGTVITTGPPHSLHLIGLGLKEKKNIRWIADFRDPWTSIGYHKSLKLTRASAKKHLLLEKRVLSGADQILTTSNTTAEEFRKLTSKPIKVITNGFEKRNELSVEKDPYFSISHIGSLLSERNPRVLWKVLSELAGEIPEFRKALRIRLTGIVSDEVVEAIKGQGLEEVLEILPYLPHNKAVMMQQSASVLLLIEINSEDTRGIIPGKLFEYMAAGRPVLAIGPEGWEAGTLVRETGSGRVFTYGMEAELKKTVLDWFGDFQKGRLVLSSPDIEPYSRKSLTRQLTEEVLWA
ncbi:Glycosyltransferase involved in cell wall bisynthesis [Muriicola jejuensis]|uniref:Glycosyltransferase n=1 Tax=Muriicola jejuensis TaxID=504488 RepID=A0A6P0UD35_9FLAO|nr:glycosyltransferase family 4 protein [Muriicola jejuensis]NER11165.1 glycosyltransferase [Muriicola jejuensis]SMP24119.1 Glycosyltransferase involved in cell wall bisynthesis [Muriicola jejuensis]